jgi:hypothetical protein
LRVFLNHPHLPSCEDCQKWLYELKTGRREEKYGLPVLRPAGVGTPCRQCPKIPEGSPPEPASAVVLSPANLRCWNHYRECRATGCWPDDARARENAALIRAEEEQAERASQISVLASLIGLRGK